MRRLAVYISELALAVFLAAMWYASFCFCALIAQPSFVQLSPLIPVVLYIAVYTADRLILRKGPGMLFYVGAQIVLSAIGAGVLQLFMKVPEGSLGLRVYAGVFFAIFVAVCAATSASELGAGSLMHRFDICLIVLAVLVFMDQYADLMPAKAGFVLLLSEMVLLLLALTLIRSEKNAAIGSRSGKAIPFILLAVVVLLAVFVSTVLSGSAQSITGAVLSAIKWAAGAVGAGLSFLWTQWTRFCAWIATLFPEGEPRNIVPEEIPAERPELPPQAEPSQASIIVLYVLTGLLAAALLGALIYRLSKLKVRKRSRRIIADHGGVRSGGGFDEIKKLLADLAGNLSYRFTCIRLRNTPAGLLAWCEAKVPGSMKRARSESPVHFLERIAAGLEASQSEALKNLAVLVERSFYSREPQKADPALCRAVRSCRFR